VLVNLVVNARDAMPGGGELRVETTNAVAAEGAPGGPEPGRYVMLSVTDTGCGMDEKTRARIFEPFFTTKQKGKGTGLGLATVYGILKQHGGHISVESTPGQGSTFKVYLPRMEETAPAMAERPRQGRPAPGTETLLLVEDDDSVRSLVSRGLKANGYTVLAAQSAQEAEVLFAAHRQGIAMLLTDVVMPGGNGRALYERLSTVQPGLPVLFMSGYPDDVIAGKGLAGLGGPFLRKPFAIPDLARRVREVLDAPKAETANA